MGKGALAIKVTKGDADLDKLFSTLEGAASLKSYHSSSGFTSYDGAGSHPLVLVGHANMANFIVDESHYPKTYRSGEEVAKNVLGRGLNATSFPFCLLAGCKAAELTKRAGLYVEFGDNLGIPVIASTTEVAMGLTGGQVTLTPQSSGTWKIYYPSEETVYGLFTPRCQGYVKVLAGISIEIKRG